MIKQSHLTMKQPTESLFRIPCEYKKQNLSIRVEESSRRPDQLVIKFLYQGGQTDIVAVDVAQVPS